MGSDRLNAPSSPCVVRVCFRDTPFVRRGDVLGHSKEFSVFLLAPSPAPATNTPSTGTELFAQNKKTRAAYCPCFWSRLPVSLGGGRGTGPSLQEHGRRESLRTSVAEVAGRGLDFSPRPLSAAPSSCAGRLPGFWELCRGPYKFTVCFRHLR